MIPKYIWRMRGSSERQGASPGGASLLERVLAARGLTADPAREAFLKPEIAAESNLAGMEKACERLRLAGRQRQAVLVHGDYDVDGITSTAIMVWALREIGCEAKESIPHREMDGYGLSRKAIDDALALGASLVVAVDCGSSDFPVIEYARSRGIDVVVLDHHETRGDLPPAVAIVNPKRPESAGATEYAAVGVCYRVARELLGEKADEVLDLVALGTVADVMPLSLDNRALVASGLTRLATRLRPGIRALSESARLGSRMSARDLGFVLAPRLNAAGRMGDPHRAYRLIMATGSEEASALALELEQENLNRQERERAMFQQAMQQPDDPGFPFAVFSGGSIASGRHDIARRRHRAGLRQEHKRFRPICCACAFLAASAALRRA